MKNEESNEPCYEDFEPYCKWKKESETSIIKQPDTLEIQLHGFKKEEVKYEIGKDGFLYISGEHPVGKNLIKRFKKKFDASKYDIKEIEATFEGGNIHLRLPRKSSAISFPNIGNEKVGILLLGKKGFKKTMTSFVMAIALLLILAFYMYKYSECTNFQNWFK